MTHIEQEIKLEQMKIDSKIRYHRNRVLSGQAPHKILEMIQEEKLASSAKKEINNDDQNWSQSNSSYTKHRISCDPTEKSGS